MSTQLPFWPNWKILLTWFLKILTIIFNLPNLNLDPKVY